MKLYLRLIYITFIYLIYRNTWILVESTDTSSANPGTGTEGGTKTGVELSIKSTAATDHFDYNKDDKVVTFTAKGNNAFKLVKTTSGSCCSRSEVTIWDAKDETEYATKVVVYGKGQKAKGVIITLIDGTTKSYKKGSCNSTWKEADANEVINNEKKPDVWSKTFSS